MPEIVGNRAIEQAAIDFVILKEHQDGRSARDTRGMGLAGDIASPPRTIEVKAYGRSARGSDLWLEVPQVEEARRNPEFKLSSRSRFSVACASPACWNAPRNSATTPCHGPSPTTTPPDDLLRSCLRPTRNPRCLSPVR